MQEMKTYKVTYERKIKQKTTFIIKADSRHQAADFGDETLLTRKNDGDIQWEDTDDVSSIVRHNIKEVKK